MNYKANKKAIEYTIDDFRELVMAFQKSRIVLTAYELEIFSAIGKDGAKSKKVATKIKADRKAAERLMNALCAIGLLKKEGDIYFNTKFSEKYLIKNSPAYITGLMHMNSLWKRWSALTEAVIKGSALDEVIDKKKEKYWTQAFIAAMHDRAKINASTLVEMLDLSKVKKVLDLGGGSGAYAIAFAKARKDIIATVFDLPDVIPLTKKYVAEEGMKKNKINFISGDYLVDDLGNGYDLILLSQIIHSNSIRDNIKLMKKCEQALNIGGQIVIQDFIIDEDRTKPIHAALFSINMLVGTEAGDTYTESEVIEYLRETGFKNMRRKDTNWGTTLIIAYKGKM